MTFDHAVRILELVQEHEMTNTRPGRIAADKVAEEYKCSQGQGLSLIVDAREVLTKGRLCPTCDGVGRLKNA